MSRKSLTEEPYNYELRLFVVQYLVLAVFIALGIRFYILQVARHQDYQAQAENNRIAEIPIQAPRGAIYDRNGVLLVDNASAFNVVVTPEDIPKDEAGRQETVRVLRDDLAVDSVEFLAKLTDPKRPKSQPILVKQNASAADRAWVAAHTLEHPEIRIEEQPQRLYKHGKLAAHVLGYIGEVRAVQLESPKYAMYKPGDIIGQGGIEAVYDQLLRGENGVRRVVVDSRGRIVSELETRPAKKGQDIITTLDIDLQRAAEEQFELMGHTGAAVAMDPRNGEILALVSNPAFDPNVFARNIISPENRADVRAIMTDPATPLFNKAIQGIYPAGSTWKILMAAAALEEGTITVKESRFPCGGGIQMGNRFVGDSGGNHGSPDIHAAIVHSCDGYFYRLGLKMGVDKINEWITRFGMGRKTGIDLPSETSGIVPSRERKKRVNPRDPVWKDFDTVIASIGQGQVAVPPLQLVRAESGILMGGEFHVPHIFKEARNPQTDERTYYDDTPMEMKIAQSTVEAVARGVWGVVNEGGTAGSVGFPRELNIGGKTGTAQVIAKEKVRGAHHKDHSWFISFAPVVADQKPEIAVVVISENGGWGARASAPKVKMINAVYFSKKFGRPVLPELVAKTENREATAPAAEQSSVPAVRPKDVNRRPQQR